MVLLRRQGYTTINHEAAEAKLWRGRGDVVLLRRRQSTKEGDEGHDGTFPEGGGR
jgi:hypothetical protein